MLGMNSILSMDAEPLEGANRLFAVTLRRSPGTKIGIDVQHVTVLGSNGLGVEKISQGGVVDTHNQSCPPAERIEVGDTLLPPGTFPTAPSRLMQDLLSNDVIQVVVLRGNKGGIISGDASVPIGKCSQLEGFPDAASTGVRTLPGGRDHFAGIGKKIRGGTSMSAYASEASTAYTTADKAMFASVNSQWSTTDSEAGMVVASTEAIRTASSLPPIGENQNLGSMTIQDQEDDPLNLNYWEHFLSRPLGSDPDICSVEGGLPRMGCMHELPPLQAILDGCDADDLVKCLPDFEVEELSTLISGMRRPPAMEEVIEAHKLSVSQKAK